MSVKREYELTNQILDILEENGMRLTEWLIEYARCVAQNFADLEEMLGVEGEEESDAD